MDTASGSFLHPTAIALGLFLLCLCAESLTSFIFLRGLRKNHPIQWEHSGQRTIWTDSDLISAWGTVRYLQRRLYLDSGNAAGIAYCAKHRLPVVTTYWAAVITVPLFFLSFFFKGWPPHWR